MTNRSSRHPKIIGEFGEHLVCNFLSRWGFETSIVDHTGIDIVAYSLETKKRLGITVKSRARGEGREKHKPVKLFKKGKKDDRQKLVDACNYFGCDEAWIAVYQEHEEGADLYLTSLDNYESKYRGTGATADTWRMGKEQKDIYEADSDVMHIEVSFKVHRWF